MNAIVIGSEAHKELFCRAFIDTHDPYDPYKVDWPQVDSAPLGILRGMPFWGEAISTERDVAKKVQALAPLEPDLLLREAIALQGYEEGRHSALLDEMLRHYDIPKPVVKEDPQSGDPLWNFMRVGYGECFDSFFAFGIYTLACESGLFPTTRKTRSDRPGRSAPHPLLRQLDRVLPRPSGTGATHAAPRALRDGDGLAGMDARQDGRCRCPRRWRGEHRRGRLHARREGLARRRQIAAPVPRSLPALE
jgi:hypothetical protein